MLSVDFSFLLLFCFVLFFRLCHVHTYLLFSPVNAHAEIRTNTLIHTQTHTPAHTYALFDYQLHISLSDVFKVMYGQESHQVNDFNLRSDNQSVLLEIDTKEKKIAYCPLPSQIAVMQLHGHSFSSAPSAGPTASLFAPF